MAAGSVGSGSPEDVRPPTRETVTEPVMGVSPPKLSAMQPQYSAPDFHASDAAFWRKVTYADREGFSSGCRRIRSSTMRRIESSRDSGRTSNSHQDSGTLIRNPPRSTVCASV
jgi:hypothetical protein